MVGTSARFGAFEIVSRLGVGGMGEVFLARRAGDDERVALKLIRPEYANDARFRRMFANEARTGLRLCHANLVRVLEQGTIDGVVYLALEYVDGVSLDRLLQEGALSYDAAIAVLRQLLAGLGFAHALSDESGRLLNLLHRDVSCSNVLVAADGTVKLTDFGIARADDQTVTSTQGVKGKLAYLAPEVLRDGARASSPAADLFGCGVVLHRALTGALPFDDALEWTGRGAPLALTGPAAIVMRRALAPDPALRFVSAAQFADALAELPIDESRALAELRERVVMVERSRPALPLLDQLILAEMQANSGPSTVVPATVPARPGVMPPPRRRGLVAVVAGAVAIIGVIGVGWAFAHFARRAPAVVTSTALAAPAPITPVPAAPIAAPAPVVAPAATVRHVAASAHAAVPRSGLLTLDTEPWATAYLGSRRLGTTPFTRVALPAGRHKLTLNVHNTGERRVIDVEVIPDSEVRLSFHLPPGAPARRR